MVLWLTNPEMFKWWWRWPSSPIIVVEVVIVVILMVKVGHVRCMWAHLQGAKSRRRYVILSWWKWRSWMVVISMHMILRWLAMVRPSSGAMALFLVSMMEAHVVVIFMSCRTGIICCCPLVFMVEVESVVPLSLKVVTLLALHGTVLELLAMTSPGILEGIIVGLGMMRRPVR